MRRTVVLLLVLAGCGSTPDKPGQTVVPSQEVAQIVSGPFRGPESEGFEFLPTPRGKDGPGTVYAVDKNGKRFDIVDLVKTDPSLQVTESPESLLSREYTATEQMDVDVLLTLMGRKALADAGGESHPRQEVTVLLSFGAEAVRETSYPPMSRAAAAHFVRHQEDWVKDSRHFVVRDAIKVKQVKYSVRAVDIEKLGAHVKAEFKPILDASAAGTKASDSRYVKVLEATYADFMRVYIKADEILTLDAAASVAMATDSERAARTRTEFETMSGGIKVNPATARWEALSDHGVRAIPATNREGSTLPAFTTRPASNFLWKRE